MFPSKLLIGIEKRDDFEIYAAEVAWLARSLEVPLVLYHATRPDLRDMMPTVQGHHNVEDLAIEKLSGHPLLKGIDVKVVCPGGVFDVVDSIIEAAAEEGADVVVVPTHARKGLPRMLFGSVAERVTRSCRVPVLTFDLARVPRTESDAPFDRVIAPVDFSDASKAAAGVAGDLARRFGAPLVLFHALEHTLGDAIELDPVTDFLENVVTVTKRRLREVGKGAAGDPVHVDVEQGRLLEALPRLVGESANPLVVMATSGRDSLGDDVLGSRTERSVRHAGASVLSLPARCAPLGDGRVSV